MRSDITALLAFVVVATWSTAAAQPRGSFQCPVLPTPPCNFATPGRTFQEQAFAENATEITFEPKLPGKYSFQFRSYDLCTYAELPVPVEVHARCPPAPTAVLNFTGQGAVAQYFLEDTVTITSEGSLAHPTFRTKADMKYTFEITPPQDQRSDVVKPTYVLNAAGVAVVTYQPPRKGIYTVKLTVTDGCSFTETQRCFEVRCNCGPTANAGKTVTMWSNNQQARSGDNNAGLDDESILQFTLDGSLSYDFDIFHRGTETLTYLWEFVSWVPSSRLPFATHFTPACQSRTSFNGTACNLFSPTSRTNFQYNDDPYNKIGSDAPWFADTNVAATVQTVGYQTVLTTTGTTTAVEFKRIGRLLPPVAKNRTETADRGIDESVETLSNDFPMWVPRYHNNPPVAGAEENFMDWAWGASKPEDGKPTTTSCMAWVTKVVTVTTSKQTVNVCETTTTTPKEPDMTYCKMQIEQASQQLATAVVTFPHPDAQDFPNYAKISPRIKKLTPTNLPVSSFEYCRGLFRFKLTVQDKCGVDTQSTDYIDVTVRCNSPPVAIAGCQTTIIYKPELPPRAGAPSGGFEQVTVDARASKDTDNSQLTYYWSFLEYPAAHATQGRKCAHDPCQQEYCQRDTYVTNPYNAVGEQSLYGNSSMVYLNGLRTDRLMGVTGYDDVCSPTVYPKIWDLGSETPANCFRPSSGQQSSNTQTMCTYKMVEETRGHLGNSAYFTPNAPGTYVVQLAVFDGCSTVIDTVTLKANCPKIEFLPAVSATGYSGITLTDVKSQLAYQVTPSVKLTAIAGQAPKFESQDPNYQQKITYQWKYLKYDGSTVGRPCDCAATSANCCVFSNPNDPTTTTFTAGERGTFRFTLSVSDGCQDPVESPASAVFVVTCNNAPVTPTLALTPTAIANTNAVFFDKTTSAYPQITITAASTDPENDRLSYNWTVREIVGSTQQSVSSSVEQSRPNVNNQNNRNDKLIIRPTVVRSGGNLAIKDGAKTFSVQATAFDGCQLSLISSRQISFECDEGLTLTASPNGNRLEDQFYSFTTGSEGFNSLSFDASASVSPYTPENSILYSWCVYGAGGSCTSNDPAAVQAQNQPRLTWRPSATKLDTYTVRLTIEDGCSTGATAKSREWQVATRCRNNPTANLVAKTSDSGTSAVTTVYWNSNARPNSGDFPPLQLDATASENAAGASNLAYDIRLVTPSSQQVSTSSTATFQAVAKGTYTFSLTVNNGPCRSNDYTTSVVFQCLPIAPRLTTLGSSQVATYPNSLLVPQQVWNGVRFPTVCLDGRGLVYGQQDRSGGVTENLNSLNYTWTVLASPINLPRCGTKTTPSCGDSMWPVSTTTDVFAPTGAIDAAELVGVTLTNQTDQYSVNNVSLAATTVMCGKGTRTQKKTTTAVTTQLFNHHYNLPLTCFVPDKKGAYTVQLEVNDGCDSVTMNAEISTGCPAPIGLSPQSIAISCGSGPCASPIQLDGIKFNRVIFDARLSLAPRNPADTLTYSWTMVARPEGSMTGLTNPHGNIASIVPDLKGTYTVSITVDDGCNPPTTTSTSIVVNCNAALVEVQAAIVKQGYVNAMVTVPNIDNTVPQIEWKTSITTNNDPFQAQRFTLKGQSGTSCTVKRRQWFLVNRECTTPYEPGLAPPVVAAVSECKPDYKCRWVLSKLPCNCNFAAVGTTTPAPAGGANVGTNQLQAGQCLRPLSEERELTVCPRTGPYVESCTLKEVVPSREDQCLTKFRCRAPGTYELTLTVNDGCQEARKSMTVSCRCETRIEAKVDPFWSSMYVCDRGTSSFQMVSLKAEVRSVAERGGLPLDACPRSPAVPAPQAAPTDTCCPAQPPCPMCPDCPTCPDMCTPQCPGTGGRAGSAKVHQAATIAKRRRAFLAKESSSSDKITFSHVMGVTIPLSGVMLLTLVGNLILHLRIKSYEAKQV